MYIFCTYNIFTDICQINFDMLSVFPVYNIYPFSEKHILYYVFFMHLMI